MKLSICETNLFLLALLPYLTVSLEYGENCTTFDDQCDTTKYLQCSFDTGTCECKEFLDTIYDPNTKECRRLVGASCTRSVGQSCVENAYCPNDINSRCTCMDAYGENNHRQCFHLHSMSCSNQNDQCDPYAFLECTLQPPGNYQCKCKYGENRSWYNTLTRTCHLTAGGETCSLNPGQMPCVPNSVCDGSSRKCQCIPGMTQTPQGLCYKVHTAPCDPFSSSETCDLYSYLYCDSLTATCLCAPPGEAIYDDGVHQCRLLAEASCNPNPGAQMCIKDATCMPDAGTDPYKCKCSYNLKPNKNRKCFLEYNSPCDRLQNYCDFEGFMTCGYNNTCTCIDSNAKYDPIAMECKLGLEAPCSPGGGQTCGEFAVCDPTIGKCRCQSGYEDDGNGKCYLSWGQPCFPGYSSCNPANNLICTDGRCQCAPGFVESSGGVKYNVTCLPVFGGTCSELRPCPVEAKLKCENGQCQCLYPSEMIYDSNYLRCRSLPGRYCDDIQDPLACTGNSYCAGIPSTCICLPGFNYTVGGSCQRTSGANRNFQGNYIITFGSLLVLTILRWK